MEPGVRRSLAHSQVIDMTTTGRRTGQPRRIEIVLHAIDGRLFISGMPSRRTRAWIHNLSTDPHLTIHLKTGRQADVPATARIIADPAERRAIFDWIIRHAWRNQDLDVMTAASPLIEVTVDEEAAA
jgi:deazaflavin-dependent oxidoreductase (nitroreductase family)